MSGRHHGSSTAPTRDELRSAGLAFSVDGPIAEIVLCAPERRNSQTPAMWRALAGLGRSMPDEVRIVILRAEGPSFSAGLDRSMLTGAADVETVRDLLSGSDLSAARTASEYQQGSRSCETRTSSPSPRCRVTPSVPDSSSPWPATSGWWQTTRSSV
jgi:hypothetical protein